MRSRTDSRSAPAGPAVVVRLAIVDQLHQRTPPERGLSGGVYRVGEGVS